MGNKILPSGNPAGWDFAQVTIFLHNIWGILTGVASTVAVIFIILGAYKYFTAYGNEKTAEEGKGTIITAVIGVILIILSQFIVNWAWQFVSGSAANFNP